ncbi:uncharacterized protein LOC135962006 [Calliphora vicina]|uniref:uncharacterized protein LOC135962006 n=1 Tax=Calliphora vicina TaxID=7373 RepID=UPI00325C1235
MSKKNRTRLTKKHKRKDRRKRERNLRKMEQPNKCTSTDENASSSNVVNVNCQADQRLSTSRHCKKKLSPKNNFKRSPWKNAGGKVNRFRKIIDDQARRIVKRSIHLVNENHSRKILTTKTVSSSKVNKRLINNSSSNINRRIVKRKSKVSHSVATLEEGEIRSETERYVANAATDTSNKAEDSDDDDCIVIEPTLEEITITDIDDDDDVPSTSDISTNYQSLIKSFKDRVSSTPCHNNNSTIMKNSNNDGVNPTNDDVLPFFEDVGRRSGIESINSTDTFIDYTKFSTLNENSQQKPRKENTCDKIINISDTGNDSTLKRKSLDYDDDSVIFISETNGNDFIPIVDDLIPPHKILKISDATSKPVQKLRSNRMLFTQSETKTLNKYNENAYNPGENKELAIGKRMVIIDGSNVAFKHALDQAFSVKGLKIAIEYFERMGHEVKAIIPQFRMNKCKSTDPDELMRLHKAGKIVQTPCKNLPGLTTSSYDDRFVLQLAFELDAAIVSNDNYRDLLHENPAFKKIVENRVIGYTWCNDIFILPKDPYGKWGPSLKTILNRT